MVKIPVSGYNPIIGNDKNFKYIMLSVVYMILSKSVVYKNLVRLIYLEPYIPLKA